MRLLIFIVLVLLSAAGFSEEVRGPARVIDGDSIEVDGVNIRLYGIDAPEGKQSCIYKGEDWACGETATEALKQIIGTASIQCVWTKRDRYERALGTCYKDGYDIAEVMVDHGLALAYTRYSAIYILNQEEAKAERKGIWGAQFIPPWEWRRGVRLAGNELPDTDCPVKGNVNRKGDRIYHAKGWRDHAKVRLKPEEGDICFQTILDAELAGFRKPRYAVKQK